MTTTSIWATYENSVAEAMAQHQYVKASAILKEALYNAKGRSEVDPKLFRSADEMATLHFRKGEFTHSASIYRVLLDLQQNSLGLEHPLTERTLRCLREALGASGSISPTACA